MVIIDGKIAVSVCRLGENNVYSYALVVRPDTIPHGDRTATITIYTDMQCCLMSRRRDAAMLGMKPWCYYRIRC